ncbi:hypothetical protein D9M69_602940 [compost metagenome]
MRSSSSSSTTRRPAAVRTEIAELNAAVTSGSNSDKSRPFGNPTVSPPNDAASGRIGASPAITASARMQSATVLAKGPIESRAGVSGKAPSSGMRRAVGLKPTKPFRAAGMRMEPPVSEPIAISLVPSAAETAAPEEEPPGTRLESIALPGTP